jgi:hypothetical protein
MSANITAAEECRAATTKFAWIKIQDDKVKMSTEMRVQFFSR